MSEHIYMSLRFFLWHHFSQLHSIPLYELSCCIDPGPGELRKIRCVMDTQMPCACPEFVLLRAAGSAGTPPSTASCLQGLLQLQSTTFLGLPYLRMDHRGPMKNDHDRHFPPSSPGKRWYPRLSHLHGSLTSPHTQSCFHPLPFMDIHLKSTP